MSNIADRKAQDPAWSGEAGQSWVALQDLMDEMLRPLGDVLLEAAAPEASVQLLDIGCGSGATTIEFAKKVGETGLAQGVDISPDMIVAAKARALKEGLPAQFIEANAQTFPFDSQTFDLIVSRFGVMFFDDARAAFQNLHSAAKENARFVGLVWRWAEDNEFMVAAERAAAPLMPELEPRVRDAAGQFGFADPEKVAQIFDVSGWKEFAVKPVDVECSFSKSDLNAYISRLGPVGRLLPTLPEARRPDIIDAMLPAFESYQQGQRIVFNAACWMIEAKA